MGRAPACPGNQTVGGTSAHESSELRDHGARSALAISEGARCPPPPGLSSLCSCFLPCLSLGWPAPCRHRLGLRCSPSTSIPAVLPGTAVARSAPRLAPGRSRRCVWRSAPMCRGGPAAAVCAPSCPWPLCPDPENTECSRTAPLATAACSPPTEGARSPLLFRNRARPGSHPAHGGSQHAAQPPRLTLTESGGSCGYTVLPVFCFLPPLSFSSLHLFLLPSSRNAYFFFNQ